MIALSVGSPSPLLGELVASFLHEVCPDAIITSDKALAPSRCRAARVTSLSTSRWIHVSADSQVDDGLAHALADGACALLTLDCRPDDFRVAVEALLGHIESFVPMQIVRDMADASLSTAHSQAEGQMVKLTDREREVLGLIALGCTNAEVASRLTISVNTVRSHLHALAVKLDANNRMRVLLNARALGLVDVARTNQNGERTA